MKLYIQKNLINDMSKRGQLTLFVIVIVAVAVASVGMYLIVKNTGVTLGGDSEGIKGYQNQVDDCFERILTDAVWLVGIHGGYVDSPQGEYEETDFGPVAYGLKDGKDLMPNKNEIENDIEEYIQDSIPFCIQKDIDSQFRVEEIISDVRIESDEVISITTVEMYLVESNKTIKSEKEYKASIPIRLGRIVDLSHEIIEKQKKSGNQIPITYLTEFEIDIIFDYYNEDTLFYMIFDKDSKVEDISYSYIFLAELNGDEEK